MTTSEPVEIPPVTPGALRLAALPVLLQTQAPIILEVGCNDGSHTNQFLRIFPRARIIAFEPDRRAQRKFRRNVTDPRAVLVEVAIGARNGVAEFYSSAGVNPGSGGRSTPDWDCSGSIRKPTGHLVRFPWCTFPEVHAVQIRTLDSVTEELGIETINFLWADVQGAEEDLIRGGIRTLARTHYIHTEYSDFELYEGQCGLAALLRMLPDFQVLARFKADVLLWNRAFPAPRPSLRGARPPLPP